ncbi:MAG: SPOR domain-containing protein [Holosporales bacterium]|jgi:hypothetical protein|nr:SPOR domain-containing protein [Holosporales bacterium]
MTLNNFRKKKVLDTRPKYLRYDDVFMSQNNSTKSNSAYNQNAQKRPPSINDSYENYDESDYTDDFEQYESPQEDNYFSNSNNIIDERMIKFQKRRLPPLQRYSESNRKNMYSRLPSSSYWEDNDEYKARFSGKRSVFGNIFQKFILTFTTILSLVCLSWIAYNWNNGSVNKSADFQNGSIIIEPELDNFKVLPENPGGENIPHKDKVVYEKISPEDSYIAQGENLLPPQEEPVEIKPAANYQNNIEEYSIIDDKPYYIKMSAGKSKSILDSEVELLKKRFKKTIGEKSCSVKKVSNAQGEKKYAILIGPFDSQETAAYSARELGGQCYVISVKE